MISKKLIESLVKDGNLMNQYPLHIKWMKAPLKERVKAQVAFTVPKRSFRKAVDRNRLKRRMREAYRLNKQLLIADELAILLVYIAKQEESFGLIEKAMKEWMLKLSKKA